NLLFSKGFTAIVGPNGSGKSNICDALLFCLGENSLHRLRASKLEDLITSGEKKTASKAYVKLELSGEENFEIVRGLSADGKSMYRVNGKRMTRQEAVELLEAHGFYTDERNTIAQGEVGKVIELNAKERRELIDAAAGIKEFEEKKEEALRELDKVNMKISEAQGIFQERFNFLKELEKEKQTAEAYAYMTARLRQLNYSMLIARISMTKSAEEAYEKDIEKLSTEKSEAEAKAQSIAQALEKANAQRQELTKQMNESSKLVGDANSRLQELSNGLAEANAKSDAYAQTIDNAEKEKARLSDEISKISKSISDNEASMERLSLELEQLESQAPEDSGAEIARLREKAEKVSGIEESLEAVRESTAGISQDLAQHELQIKHIQESIEKLNKQLEEAKAEIAAEKAKEQEASKNSETLNKEIGDEEEAIKAIEKRLSELDSKVIEWKEQRALSSSRDNSAIDRVERAFKNTDGFYGTVSELCEYDPEYALAVEAAAGNRLNYLVVESIEIANKAIQYMKDNKIGRATFIPLAEIRPVAENPTGLKPLLSAINYDKKFEKAFRFVFGNTYIVDTLQDAKKAGIGKCRYVTMSGDLVEASGLVSGGTRPQAVSTAVIERQIKEASDEIERLMKQRTERNEKLFELRKELALNSAQVRTLNESIEKLEKLTGEVQKELDNQSNALKLELNAEASINAQLEKQLQKQKELEDELAKEKELLNEAYAIADTKHASSGLAEIAQAKKEIENRKIRIAELNKENQMLKSKLEEDSKAIERLEKAEQEAKKSMEALNSMRARLEKEKKELEDKIRNSNDETKGIYEKISQLEEESIRLGKQSGEINARIKELDTEIKDTQIKKSQLETRLNDLSAELEAYEKGIEPVQNLTIEEMENEANKINVKIAELGTVNMKAPEIYEQKKKEVDEAQAKLDTLENERRAVLNLIDEVDKKKLATFMATFEQVNKNFSKMYSYVLPGSAELELENKTDPFAGGLEIKITGANAAGKLAALSGGQKALVSLMLLFAIHMYKPASFYIFDEIDSMLDKENSKKLSQLIKQLSSEAQFIVVSHNDSLIINSDTAIGVVKTNGESKAVGVEVNTLSGQQQATVGADNENY
ncbi:MAG: AAA family ATPase, partial [Candidatus Micrarchaeia archaeon]